MRAFGSLLVWIGMLYLILWGVFEVLIFPGFLIYEHGFSAGLGKTLLFWINPLTTLLLPLPGFGLWILGEAMKDNQREKSASVDQQSTQPREAPPEIGSQLIGFIERGRPADAVAFGKRALESTPQDWYLHYIVGVAHRHLGDNESSLEALTVADRLHHDAPPVLLALGISQQACGNLESATKTLCRAIEIEPGLVEGYISLGLTQRMAGRLEDALKTYQKGIDALMSEISRKINEAGTGVVQVQENGRRINEIRPEFFSAVHTMLKADMRYAALRNNMGICLATLGMHDEARDVFRDGLDCVPDGMRYEELERNLASLEEMAR